MTFEFTMGASNDQWEEEELRAASFEEDEGHYDRCYYRVLELDLSGNSFFITIRREHPQDGIMIQLGESGEATNGLGCNYVGCGFKSYEDILTLFSKANWPIEVPTWDGGSFSIEKVMDSSESFSTVLVYDAGDSILNFSWNMFLSDQQESEFIGFSKRVVEYCERKISESA